MTQDNQPQGIGSVAAPTVNGRHYLWVVTLKSPFNGHDAGIAIVVSPNGDTAHDEARKAIRQDMKKAGYDEAEIKRAEYNLQSYDKRFVVTVDIAAYRP